MDGRILIVDDEARIGSLLVRALRTESVSAETCDDPERALRRLKEEPFDIVITDLRMPGMDGLELLRRVRAIRPECEVVLMTAYASIETAREALKRGAVDYLTKPFSIEAELKPLVRRILDTSVVGHGPGEVGATATPGGTVFGGSGIVGGSDSIRLSMEMALKIARSNSQVLIRGESGTGKELFASLIHRLSARAERPLVKVNCAALPDNLLESELFGYAKGAFTGATRDRLGIFQAADGGTLFLDEIGELSPTFQPKLLRVLQDGVFQRLGESHRPIQVDVRVIAATNCNLEEAVQRGRFRRDLYYRINVVPLELPPLRDHLEDLPELIHYFMSCHGAARRRCFGEVALQAMHHYAWPGNVRELSNAVEYALVIGESEEVGLADLPVAIQEAERLRASGGEKQAIAEGTLDQIEMKCIVQTLVRTGFNRTRAARLLGITRRTLGYRINKYQLEPEIEAAQKRENRSAMRSVRPPARGGSQSLGA